MTMRSSRSPVKRSAEGSGATSPSPPKRRSPVKRSRSSTEPPPETSTPIPSEDRRQQSKSDEPQPSSSLLSSIEDIAIHDEKSGAFSDDANFAWKSWASLRRKALGRGLPVYSGPLPANHAVRQYWDTILDRSIEWLCARKVDWSCVSCVMRGVMHEGVYDDPDAMATILVVTSEPEHQSRLCIARDLSKHLRDVAAATDDALFLSVIGDTDVEVLQGRYGRFSLGPRPGSSLSGKGKAEGTFGGYLKILRKDAPSIIAGITCHHIFDPVEKTRVPFQAEGHPECTLRSPCDSEYAGAMRLYDHHQLVRTDPAQWFLNMLDEGQDLPTISARLPIEQAAADARPRPDPDRSFGKLWGSSGQGVYEGSCIDWALILLKPGTRCHNTIIHDERAYIDQLRESADFQLKSLTGDCVQPGLGKLAVNMGVHCQGFKTSCTYGVCTGLKLGVQLDGDAGPTTKEWQVVTRNLDDFARPGDSGALVTNGRGQVVGMVVGGPVQTGHGLPSYITPIDNITATLVKALQEDMGWIVTGVELDVANEVVPGV